ncbi:MULTISPECIES: DUF6319 family protein [Actinosynnema]|uniref:DUF6319 family protein n=1 Tax=Actinosynnema TaxID=40566 RepID=UPI0020A461D5|nr:DUF6319 family protein [Actinosynnema pretiosum]MCP2095514.1 hypothetical protein [Actinosynnema pretiosum]
MAKAKQSLSPEDLDHLRAELDAGRQPPVWFTASAVGMEAGKSAKVLALTDPPEGDFIQVRPTGARDELSFSPAELTLEKPAPRKKEPAPPPPPPAAAPVAAASVEPGPVEHIYTPEPPPAKPKPAAKTAPKKPVRGVEVTVTLNSTADGEWTVDVQSGSKRTLRAAPISAALVAQAARSLLPEVHEAVEGVLAAAREKHLARVEQLRTELEAAQRALDELSE